MPTTARAAVVTGANVAPVIEDITVADPRADEVLVRVAAGGICHTDIAIATGELWPRYPIVLGHEIAGVVEGVGADVTAVRPGDRVIVIDGHCGRCRDCDRGYPVLCQADRHHERRLHHFTRADGSEVLQSVGGFSEATLVPENCVVKVPEGVPLPVAAVIGCAVVTGAGAVFNVAQVRPGQTVAVIGSGGVGVNAIMAAKACGAAKIVAVDPNKSRRELGTRFGATHTAEPDEDALLAMEPEGFDVVIECAGKVPAMELGPRILRRAGVMTLIGATPEGVTFRIDALDFLLNEKRLLGCLRGNEQAAVDYPRYFEMYQRGLLDLDALITATVPLDDIAAGFERSKAEQGLRTVVVHTGF
jgi:S-(hydroxymethyl)glutathione dehydrogenase/alcohol dehydrogenase